MCKAVAELAEDDNEKYKVCWCLHSFLACFFFQVFDFFAVIFTFVVYYIVLNLAEDGWTTTVAVPLSALIASFLFFPSGPYGLFLQKPGALVVYLIRVIAILLYSITWAIYIHKTDESNGGLVVKVIWSCAAVLYLWGVFVTLKAIAYTTLHYRGYDDVDPALQKHFEEELKERMIRIKQREMDEKRRESEMESSGVEETKKEMKTTAREGKMRARERQKTKRG